MDTAGLNDFIDNNDFSGVVLIRHGKRVIFESATGQASQRREEAITMDTRFDTASITKLFTAVAVLQQVAAGNLDLEASIHHYVDLAGTRIPIEVNLLHLLTHTSGIADDADEESGESYDDLYSEVPSYSFTQTADYLQQFVQKESLADPGVETNYINAGYILAGLALERVTDVPYRQYVLDEIFAKAGMSDSGFWDRREAAPRLAEGWDQRDDGTWFSNVFSYPPIGSPSDGAQVTASDLLSFFTALRDGRLLNKEFTEEFFLPQVELDDETMYGFGLEFDMNEDGTVRSYYKDGLNAGASGILRHYVEEDIDVVVLSNSEDGAWDVITEIDERL